MRLSNCILRSYTLDSAAWLMCTCSVLYGVQMCFHMVEFQQSKVTVDSETVNTGYALPELFILMCSVT